MTHAFLVFALLAADPSPEQLQLLKTFREEFVAITPREITPRDAKLQPLLISKYEVTQNMWQSVMGDNPSRWKGPRNSVEMVSLPEADEFCRKVTKLLQAAALTDPAQIVRLPTEAEWEFAARAGTTTQYSFGDDSKDLPSYGWFTGNAAGNDPPVGAKKPNPWGLYDMHGYLWEWIASDNKSAGREKQAVIRGGSWKDKAEDLTSGSRRVVNPNLRDDAVGLRCVLTSLAVQAAVPSAFRATAQDRIVPAGAKLEMVWGDGDFTEGPALAPDGSIFFSDIGDSIYRYDPKTGKKDLFRRPSGRANGLMFNPNGDLIACEGANTGGNRRISITTGITGAKDGTVKESTAKTLADRYDGKRFNSPNDLAIDSVGRVYFTDPRYVGGEPRELDFEAVFLVATDGTVKIATREVTKPNGILISPDGKTVYLADNNPQGNRHLVAFAVKPDGTLDAKHVLFDFGSGRGIDGMALDTSGNIYAAAGTRDKAGIYVFGPAGQPLAFLPTPGDPTNCDFGGGNDGSTLYVTCANSHDAGTKYGLYRATLNATGHHVVKLK
jgi:gluconolactonase